MSAIQSFDYFRLRSRLNSQAFVGLFSSCLAEIMLLLNPMLKESKFRFRYRMKPEIPAVVKQMPREIFDYWRANSYNRRVINFRWFRRLPRLDLPLGSELVECLSGCYRFDECFPADRINLQ